MCASETWSLTQKQEESNKNEQGRWGIRTSRELTEIFGDETIVGAIKSARLRWTGHVVRMDDNRIPKKTLE